MSIITGTHFSLSTVVPDVIGVEIADFRLEMRYIELDDLYQLSVIGTIMAVTKYGNLSTKTKLSTKK